MTPEKEFEQNIWWILQEIKTEQLRTSGGKKIELWVYAPSPQGLDCIAQHQLLLKLEEWKAIGSVEAGIPLYNGQGSYLLTIHQAKFDEIYKKYKQLCQVAQDKKEVSASKEVGALDKWSFQPIELNSEVEMIKIDEQDVVLPMEYLDTKTLQILIYLLHSATSPSINQVSEWCDFGTFASEISDLELDKYFKFSTIPKGRWPAGRDDTLEDIMLYYGEPNPDKNLIELIDSTHVSIGNKKKIEDFIDKYVGEFERGELVSSENFYTYKKHLDFYLPKWELLFEQFGANISIDNGKSIYSPKWNDKELRFYEFILVLNKKGYIAINKCYWETEGIPGGYDPENGRTFQPIKFSSLKLNVKFKKSPQEIIDICNGLSRPGILLNTARELQEREEEQQKASLAYKNKEQTQSLEQKAGEIKPKNNEPEYIQQVEVVGLEEGLRAIAQGKREDKNKFPHKLPAGTTWENITIKFLDDENVFIQVLKNKHNTNYKEMGFVGGGQNPKPSVAWAFLKTLAGVNCELTIRDPVAKDKHKKQKELLSKALQSYFSIDYDPFYPYRSSSEKRSNSYKIKITLIPPELKNGQDSSIKKEDTEKNLDEQIAEDIKESMPEVLEPKVRNEDE